LPGLALFYILQHMKQILVEVDDRTAAELERVAPARSRQRSEFIRRALRRALWDEEERATREAYLRTPDAAEPTYIEPKAWDAPAASRGRRKKR
jgi:Arc/MetJ-type ribon-helix-helix transcriptional regulator